MVVAVIAALDDVLPRLVEGPAGLLQVLNRVLESIVEEFDDPV